MSRCSLFLVFSAIFCLAFARSSPSRRQITLNRGYLPRCKFDDHIIKNTEQFLEKIDNAQFVFTGKVTGDIVITNNTIKFSVVVRRYFKNVLGLTRNKEVRVLKTLNDGEGVKCRQPIRPKYTAVFIGRKLSQRIQDADLILTLSPVPITLNNLDRVSAATKGTPLKTSGDNSHPGDRIIGGRDADIADYPYQLSLEDNGFFCGAILIAEDWALTAAHCTIEHEVENIQIRAGSSYVESGGEVVQVKKIYQDPLYSLEKDISLLKLSSKVTAKAAKPIDLATSKPKAGEMATVTGWGMTDFDTRMYPDVLQAVDVPIVSFDDCQKAFTNISDNMVCAGILNEGGKDACGGDSGGPLVVNGTLVGIVSFGIGCGLPGYPGVYASVPNFFDWIKEAMASDR